MKLITTKKFPKATIGTISAEGIAQNEREDGVTVNIWGQDDNTPTGAEVFSTDSNDEDNYADIGLIIEGKNVVDYDGVFEIPNVLVQALNELGYTVSL